MLSLLNLIFYLIEIKDIGQISHWKIVLFLVKMERQLSLFKVLFYIEDRGQITPLKIVLFLE